MKQYKVPEIEIDLFEVDDVLSTSESLEPTTVPYEDFTTPEDTFADE